MEFKFKKESYLDVKRQPLAGSSFINWVKVLLNNKLKVDWRFTPRAAYVSLMTFITTPLRYNEKMKFDKKINNLKIKDPIFIIGHWRSGTTFLHYLLGQDKNLGYSSTMQTLRPSIFLNYEEFLRKTVKKTLPQKRPMDNLEMETELPYEEEYAIANTSPFSFYHAWYFPRSLEDFFKKYVLFENINGSVLNNWKEAYLYFIKKLSYKYNGNQIHLKSLVNTARIKHLLEIFPEAKFIHLYRNPYKVYLSTWKLYQSILPMFSFQRIKNEELDKAILNIYKMLYIKYFEEKDLIPQENLLEFSYEGFTTDPMNSITQIYQKFNIDHFKKAKPYLEKYVKKHVNYKGNHHRIDQGIKDKVYQNWDFAFKQFNYSK